jgi:hypothetical protein
MRQSEPYEWYPQGGNYLTTCWRQGDQIHDVIIIDVPPVSQPVVWNLTLRVVDLRTGDVAEVRDAAGRTNTATLGGINYP